MKIAHCSVLQCAIFRPITRKLPKIYSGQCGKKLVKKLEIPRSDYTFRAQIIISQQRNWEQLCYRKISDSIYFQGGPTNIYAILCRSVPLSWRSVLWVCKMSGGKRSRGETHYSDSSQQLLHVFGHLAAKHYWYLLLSIFNYKSCDSSISVWQSTLLVFELYSCTSLIYCYH